MKKFLTVILMISAITAGSFTTASAMDFLLGVRGGYFIWEPYIKEIGTQFNQMGTGSGALYGPVASILLTDDLSLSFSGLLGQQNGAGLSQGVNRSDISSSTYQDIKFSFEVFRVDLDGALSYRLTENFKIFAGYKYWYLNTEYKAISYLYSSNILTEARHEESTIKQPFHGPAAGLGISAPLGSKGYFFAMNVSGLYMWGKFKFDQATWDQYESSSPTPWLHKIKPGQSLELDMKMYGVMIEPTIGINPGEDLPIITLGVRYQYNRMKVLNPPAMMSMNEDWLSDKIYGVFIGILYKI